MPSVQTVLCVPGNWQNRSEIVAAIAQNNLNNYIFAGTVLRSIRTGQTYEVEIDEAVPQLEKSFQFASQFAIDDQPFSASLLQQIADHKQILYLIGEGGSVEQLKGIVQAGIALLNAGGIAIKVESTGVAHTAEKWRSYAAGDLQKLFFAFVALIHDNGTMFSVGMHHFGLRDGIIQNVPDAREAHTTLGNFLMFYLIESPKFGSGHTFSLSPQAPVYQLREEICQTYPEGDLFHNPFGMWKLQPV